MRADEAALIVACPKCGSNAKTPCVNTTNGVPFPVMVHGERSRLAWKHLIAQQAKDARNRRGKRPAPQITGIVIPRQGTTEETGHR